MFAIALPLVRGSADDASWAVVRRGFAAIEFYKAAFGTVEDYRVGGSRADEPVVAQLSVDGASFWVADESPPRRQLRIADPFGRHWEIGKPLGAWPPAGHG